MKPITFRRVAERRRLINRILQLHVNAVFCFRAREKAKPEKGGKRDDLVDLGWMPIAGEEFLYEMTANALLPPGANGMPDWAPPRPGERQMVKLPAQFRDLLPGRVLDEDAGEAMARWAAGEGDGAVAYRFPNGPHKGEEITGVPDEYLDSLRLKLDGSKPKERRVLALVEKEIERRAADVFGDDDEQPDLDFDAGEAGAGA